MGTHNIRFFGEKEKYQYFLVEKASRTMKLPYMYGYLSFKCKVQSKIVAEDSQIFYHYYYSEKLDLIFHMNCQTLLSVKIIK